MSPPGLPSYYRTWDSPFSYAPPPTPLPFGLSHQELAGMGAGGAALTSLAPMLSEYARNRFGAFGFTFGSGMNPSATEYGRDFIRQSTTARQVGADADQAALNDLLRGLAVVMGHRPDDTVTRAANDGRVRFDEGFERVINRLASDGSKMLPFLATMMPDAVDAALPGGSRAVAAGAITAANRFRIDPTTGRSLAEDAQFTNRLLDPLIAAGPGATDGLRAGRVGNLYAELANRGLLGGRDDAVLTQELGGATFGAAGAGLPTQARIREGQADRTREQLAGYAKTIAAINEIFAENGRADAPMQALVRGLETMTQGGLSMYRADQLTKIVRTFQGAGQAAGLTLEAMQGMSGTAGAQLAAFGAHRGLAAPAALYAAAAGAAFNRSGYSVGPETGGQAEQIAMALGGQTSFAGSEVANVIGALDVQSRYLGAGGANTDLGRVVANMRAGRFETRLGDGSTFDVRSATGAQLSALAAGSGLSAQAMTNQLQFGTRQNRAAFVGNDAYTQQLGVGAQRFEIERSISSRFGSQIDQALGGQTTHRQFFDALYAAADSGDVTTVDQAVKRAMSTLGRSGQDAAELGPLIDSVFGEAANARGLTDVTGIAGLRSFSPQFRNRAGAALSDFDARGDRAQRLAQLNPQGPGSAATDAIVRAGRVAGAGGYYNVDTGELDWTKMIAMGAFGGVDGNEALRALAKPQSSGWAIYDWAAESGQNLRSVRPGTGSGSTRITGELTIIRDGVRMPATLNGEQNVPNVGGAR